MFSFAWKQHRKQLGLGVGLVALLLIFMMFASAGKAGMPNMNNVTIVRTAGIATPLLMGIFWGAPLLSREYEAGTHQLAWTQGISRRKWLAVKLGLFMGVAGLACLILGLVTSTWISPFSRFAKPQFDITGVMPMFYAMFAVAAGAMIGAWRRRVVSAIAITLVLTAGIHYALAAYIRPHYMAPKTYTQTYTNCVTYHTPRGISGRSCGPQTPPVQYADSRVRGTWHTRYTPSATSYTDTYQPANRYWTFQVFEGGIYFVLTAFAVGVTYRLVLRRDA